MRAREGMDAVREAKSEPVMATCGPGCGGVGRGAGRGSRRDRRARTGPRGEDLSRFSALKCRSGPHGACAGDLAHAGEPAGRGLCELTRPVTRLGRRSQPRGQTVTQTARPSVPLPTSAATPMRARAKGLGVAGRPSPDPERTAGLDSASSPERLGVRGLGPGPRRRACPGSASGGRGRAGSRVGPGASRIRPAPAAQHTPPAPPAPSRLRLGGVAARGSAEPRGPG